MFGHAGACGTWQRKRTPAQASRAQPSWTQPRVKSHLQRSAAGGECGPGGERRRERTASARKERLHMMTQGAERFPVCGVAPDTMGERASSCPLLIRQQMPTGSSVNGEELTLQGACFRSAQRAALAVREQFPTPAAVATASMTALQAARMGRRPSDADLVRLQDFAGASIGTNRVGRQRGLVLEQTQLITELRLLQRHLEQLEAEIGQIARQSREGQILTSIPGIGPVQAATILAAIGHSENFRSAAALKSYFGWAPTAGSPG